MVEPRSLAVVIPVHNEGEHLGALLTEVSRPIVGVGRLDVVVVDDGSTDGCGAIAAAAGATLIQHPEKMGKGVALRDGCDHAHASGVDLIAVMDGDGQHSPVDLANLVAPLLDGGADVVIGARTRGQRMPISRRTANRVLTSLLRVLFGARVSDCLCGMRAFTSAAYPGLRWSTAGYAVESEMIVRLSRGRLRLREVEIATIYLSSQRGAKAGDGVRIALDLLRWRLGGLPSSSAP